MHVALYSSPVNGIATYEPFGEIVDDYPTVEAIGFGCTVVARTTKKTISYPFDVVHRRMQMPHWSHADMVQVFKKTLRNEGLKVLYKSLTLEYLKIFPIAAVVQLMFK